MEENEKQTEAQDLNIRKRRLVKAALCIVVTVLAVAGVFLLAYAAEMSPRLIFGSDAEMMDYLEGTWGNGTDAFSITNGEATVYYGYSDFVDHMPVSYSPDNGTFKIFGDTYIVYRDTETLTSRATTYHKTSDQAERPYSHKPPLPQTESALGVLKIHDVQLEYGDNDITCTGKMTNNGEKTYYHVLVKCAFECSDGTVADTRRIYVVYEEGLAPGESIDFDAKTGRDDDIRFVVVSLEAYDYEKYQ